MYTEEKQKQDRVPFTYNHENELLETIPLIKL
jgi:hypothetical protein